MFVIIIAILAFLMSFSIGANDAANALATSYGSKALKLIWLVILGSIFEFIGAYFCSGHVAGELIIGIIPDIETLDDDTVAKMMLGASIASFIFIMASSVFGMPISGTHTVIGALIGCGIAGLGAETIDWGKLGIICIGWVVAPLLAIIMTCLLILAVCNLTMNLARSFQTRLLWLTVFTACASAMIAFMFISLIKDSDSEFTPAMWACLGCSPILGLFVTRLIFVKLVEPSNKIVQYNFFSLVFKFWSAQAFEEILHAKQ
jgi:PiT family inorganic phosphate transporter